MQRWPRVFAVCALALYGAAAGACEAAAPPGMGLFDGGAADDGAADEASAEAAVCVGDGEACEHDGCCEALECLALNGGPLTCHARCDDATECSSGCCISLSRPTPRKLCGAAELCFPDGCEPEGDSCDAETPCCAGLTCVVGALPESRNGCRLPCEQPEHCESGCCTLFGEGDRGGFCDDALYCSCLEQGEDCIAPGRDCCDNTRCARFGEDPFSCLPICESDDDCDGNCCASLGGSDKVCATSPC